MIYVKVSGSDTLYPASISGRMSDKEWGGRESKAITMEADFATVDALFADDTDWSIVMENAVPAVDEEGNAILDENGEATYNTEQVEYDNSEYSIRGDLTVHQDGKCTVKMGKPTAEELLAILLGVN